MKVKVDGKRWLGRVRCVSEKERTSSLVWRKVRMMTTVETKKMIRVRRVRGIVLRLRYIGQPTVDGSQSLYFFCYLGSISHFHYFRSSEVKFFFNWPSH